MLDQGVQVPERVLEAAAFQASQVAVEEEARVLRSWRILLG